VSEALQFVCRAGDLRNGEMKAFSVGRISVLVAREGDHFYALRNVCPHQGADLAAGWFGGTSVPSQAGQVVFGRSGEIVRCPWHNWEFDVRTGCSLHDPEKQRVKAYKVVVDGDRLLVDAGSRLKARP
jgi:nitrite reductase/ring-hydroxylating ferredoxin subunit